MNNTQLKASIELEDYLRQIHAREHPEVLDDDMPDHFDSWLVELELSDLMIYAQEAVQAAYALGRKEGEEQVWNEISIKLKAALESEKQTESKRKYKTKKPITGWLTESGDT